MARCRRYGVAATLAVVQALFGGLLDTEESGKMFDALDPKFAARPRDCARRVC